MASKIIGGIGSLFGKKKKKAAPGAEAPAAEQKGPIITMLGNADPRRRPLARSPNRSGVGSILGGGGTLGG